MASLPVKLHASSRARRRTLRIEVDAEKFERLAANFGFFGPEFLASLNRAEADVRAGRVRKISSLRALRRSRRR
jgi:hypothetical protein